VKRPISIAFGLLLLTSYGHAQEAVTPAADADALFHSADPKLNANKQVAYMIIKDLLECSSPSPNSRSAGNVRD
jgi:hypothetical protein